jgi:hypothetical protein
MILARSASDAASPFIFQLPARSGIILAAAIQSPFPACDYQKLMRLSRPVPRSHSPSHFTPILLD